jgi:hypothetical protein
MEKWDHMEEKEFKNYQFLPLKINNYLTLTSNHY